MAILNTQASVDETIQDLPHINLFDEKEIKEVISDPVGSKYPMAVFTFDDKGKILEIKLPNNMDEYHAETIAELIEKIIPKLSGNKNEDMSKGLEIKKLLNQITKELLFKVKLLENSKVSKEAEFLK